MGRSVTGARPLTIDERHSRCDGFTSGQIVPAGAGERRVSIPASRDGPMRQAGNMITSSQVANFLSEDLRMAQVAAVSKSGVPVLGSLWFVFDSDRFWFSSHPSSPLAAAAARAADLAVLIDQFDPPDRIRQVRVRGPGRVETHYPERVQQIYERYLGRDVSVWPDFFRERVTDDTWTLWSVSPIQGTATINPNFREQSTRWACFADSPFAAL
jgi:hypothetical protein